MLEVAVVDENACKQLVKLPRWNTRILRIIIAYVQWAPDSLDLPRWRVARSGGARDVAYGLP